MGESTSTPCSSNSFIEIAGNYGVAHKHLVQLIIGHGILQTHYFYNKFVHYVQIYNSDSTITQPDEEQEKILVEKLIATINNALASLFLRLIQVDDEYDDENSYIVLLSDQRPSNFLFDASGFTQTEVTLFYLWVCAICNSENGEILKHEALSIASDLLAKDEERAVIRLDTRAVAELQNYFSAHTNQFKLEKCVVCGKFIVMKNRAVFCETCRSFCHRQCGLKIIKSVRTERVLCPGKLASGESCSVAFHVPDSTNGVERGRKGSHRRHIVNDFEEQHESDVALHSTERSHDAKV
ncbi:unnamed protein product [Litomosoides sigmodontis]|uniref:Phorbol-ester/DAG-type domain-containing protein n=1 Tax=Litomosoides sigmodontis TaxID=42156 RepID=A0A3P6TTV1_LITSI|nr:unnamed protein product [Litomosoides sigmodontis]